jgi:hypothetical protein
MGRSFEHHLEAVFRAHELDFDVQARTEFGNTVDFLFPGYAAYHNQEFPSDRLTMLAAKSTCKDRWRQVLPEARRIWPKHLITLEPAISSAQLDQMRAEQLQLVLPKRLHDTYRPEAARWLMTPASFVEMVRDKALRLAH